MKYPEILLILLLGILLFSLTSCAGGAFWRRNYETNTHEITEAFSDILIDTDTADITFLPAEDGVCRVVSYEHKHAQVSVSVQDGKLTMRSQDERRWYEHLLAIHAPKLSVYLPATEYATLTISEDTGDIDVPQGFRFENADIRFSTGDVCFGASVEGSLKIKGSTGDVCAKHLSAGALDVGISTGDVEVSDLICVGDVSVTVTTGDVDFANVTCNNLITTGGTGTLVMHDVTAATQFSIARSTGDVIFERCDAAEVFITTSTGDVKGSFRSDKVFLVRSDTGRIDAPKTITGGRCEITTSTGDIKIGVS